MDLQVVVSHPTWMLGTEPSPGREASALSCKPSLQPLFLSVTSQKRHFLLIEKGSLVATCPDTWALFSILGSGDFRRATHWSYHRFKVEWELKMRQWVVSGVVFVFLKLIFRSFPPLASPCMWPDPDSPCHLQLFLLHSLFLDRCRTDLPLLLVLHWYCTSCRC